MANDFELLPIAMDLSECSLEFALSKLDAEITFNLYVHKDSFLETKDQLRKWISWHPQDPFSAQVNLYIDKDLDTYGWYLEYNGKRVGSHGA